MKFDATRRAMSAITLDTDKFVGKLKKADFEAKQAERQTA